MFSDVAVLCLLYSCFPAVGLDESKALSTVLVVTPLSASGVDEWTTIVPAYRSKPVCPDTAMRYGYHINAWFIPWVCNYRYDVTFRDSCLSSLAAKRILFLGSSLENYMVETITSHDNGVEQTGLGEVLSRKAITMFFPQQIGGSNDVSLMIKQRMQEAFRENWDVVVIEIIQHEGPEGCDFYEQHTLPVIEHLLDEHLFRNSPDPLKRALVNTSNPHYDAAAPLLPPPLAKDPRVIITTGSAVQWHRTRQAHWITHTVTNHVRMQHLSDLLVGLAHRKQIPVIDRMQSLAALDWLASVDDNVHYEPPANVLQWRLLLHQLCLPATSVFTDEQDRYDTSRIQPMTFAKAGH